MRAARHDDDEDRYMYEYVYEDRYMYECVECVFAFIKGFI